MSENEKFRYTAPILDKINEYTPEQATGARVVLEILYALRQHGMKAVSKAMLLEILGCEDQIKPGDEDHLIELTDEYLENKAEVDATFEARVAPKH